MPTPLGKSPMPSKMPTAAAEPVNEEFDLAAEEFIAALQSGDTAAAKSALKMAIKACYASEV